MTCLSCAERAELLAKAYEAYQRGDMQETKRLIKETFGTVVKDFDVLVLKRSDGTTARFDLRSNKPEQTP